MSNREVRVFDYVNQPYERVRDALRADAPGVLQSATRQAGARTGELVASLSVELHGVEVSKGIVVHVGPIREEPGPRLSRVTHLEVAWKAEGAAGLFPTMKADLAVYPLSATETHVDLRGDYEPPLGLVGGAIDAIVGHRIAEAAVHRFVTSVVARLRDLPAA